MIADVATVLSTLLIQATMAAASQDPVKAAARVMLLAWDHIVPVVRETTSAAAAQAARQVGACRALTLLNTRLHWHPRDCCFAPCQSDHAFPAPDVRRRRSWTPRTRLPSRR